jgi:TolB protein
VNSHVLATLLLFGSALTSLPAPTERAAFPGRNGKIVFTSRGAIDVMNADGSHRHLLVKRPRVRPRTTCSPAVADAQPTWSPDGRRIAFVRYGCSIPGRQRGIYLANADGSGERRLTSGIAPTWSPDSRRLAFVRTRGPQGGHSDVFVIGVDGTGLMDLTNSPAHEAEPAWSPDGTRIAFTSEQVPGAPQIYTMNRDGSQQQPLTPLTNAPNNDTQPSWSPDGTEILFKRDAGLVVMNADGSNPRLLKPDPRANRAAWSPDGRKITFDKLQKRFHRDIWVMNADGTGATPLTRTTRSSESDADWQPKAGPGQ